MPIQIRDLHKSFGDKVVLDGFTVEAHDGETLVIMGGSGSGKSVTLKHVVGLLEPDRGAVVIDGREVASLSRDDLYELRREVGYVFQFAALFDSLSLADNVGLGLHRAGGFSRDEIRGRVEECLELVDLAGFEDRFPAELSGGQKKRAGIARAIATRPRYLLYDEPTTGLDPLTKAMIDQLILRTAEELGVTGIMITHDIDSAFRVGDRFAMLYEGRCRFCGTGDEIRSSDDPVVRSFIEGRPELLEATE